MNFRFDFEKSLQAAGCLLELQSDRMRDRAGPPSGTLPAILMPMMEIAI